MWATRGVRGSPAHRQSAFLLLEVLRPGQNHRALNSLQCPDDGNARRQKMYLCFGETARASAVELCQQISTRTELQQKFDSMWRAISCEEPDHERTFHTVSQLGERHPFACELPRHTG